MAENVDVWELWNACETQWRSGVNGIIGLDYPAVFQVAERMEIDIDRMALQKIKALETNMLISMRDDKRKAIREYCQTCIDAGRNTDCHECDLTMIKKEAKTNG